MKSTVVKDAAGAVINIGPWDYMLEPVMADDTSRPLLNNKGEPEGFEQIQVGERALNPLPEGAYVSEEEVVDGEDGGKYAATNHAGLRRAAYPSIGDQLDALFKAGLFPPELAAQIVAVKTKYPKAGG